MGSSSCSSNSSADVFPPWRHVNTHLNVAEQKTAKSSAFIEVLTLKDDQLIKCKIGSNWLLLTFFFTHLSNKSQDDVTGHELLFIVCFINLILRPAEG